MVGTRKIQIKPKFGYGPGSFFFKKKRSTASLINLNKFSKKKINQIITKFLKKKIIIIYRKISYSLKQQLLNKINDKKRRVHLGNVKKNRFERSCGKYRPTDVRVRYGKYQTQTDIPPGFKTLRPIIGKQHGQVTRHC